MENELEGYFRKKIILFYNMNHNWFVNISC